MDAAARAAASLSLSLAANSLEADVHDPLSPKPRHRTAVCRTGLAVRRPAHALSLRPARLHVLLQLVAAGRELVCGLQQLRQSLERFVCVERAALHVEVHAVDHADPDGAGLSGGAAD